MSKRQFDDAISFVNQFANLDPPRTDSDRQFARTKVGNQDRVFGGIGHVTGALDT